MVLFIISAIQKLPSLAAEYSAICSEGLLATSGILIPWPAHQASASSQESLREDIEKKNPMLFPNFFKMTAKTQ